MFGPSKLNKLLEERIQNYTDIIERLSIDSAKKKQLHVDFINFIRIIEKIANGHLIKNDITNIAVIILSAIVPILINFTPKVIGTNVVDRDYLNMATLLSVLLAILNGLRQSYKFRERWQNYRQTAEKLILEGQSYFALSGKYIQFPDHDAAFRVFIETINVIRTKQLDNYISQLMAINDQEIAQSISNEVNARITSINLAKEKINLRKLINDELNAFVKDENKIAYFETDHERKLVTLFVNDRSFVAPEKFTFKNQLLAGQVYRIETVLAEPEIQSKLIISTGVKNKDMPSRDFGSAGCILKRSDGSVIFLTCYHVVKHTDQDWDFFDSTKGHADVIDTDNVTVGQIVDAEKSDNLDTALIKINENVKFDDLLPGQIAVKTPVFIDESNLQDFTDVFIISRARGFRQIQGKLAEVNKLITMNYGSKLNPDRKNLAGLMIVHYVSTEKFSVVGDSGSLVFTSDGTPIGIIVAGDLIRASFVIPFTTINDHYNFKFD
jgi:hypothetical protein